MTPHEKAQRLAALAEIFVGLGIEASADRLRIMAIWTEDVPIEVFGDACRRAVRTSKGGFPPGAGDILAAALALKPGELNAGQERSLPKWYRVAIGKRTRSEKPVEIGKREASVARIGAGS